MSTTKAHDPNVNRARSRVISIAIITLAVLAIILRVVVGHNRNKPQVSDDNEVTSTMVSNLSKHDNQESIIESSPYFDTRSLRSQGRVEILDNTYCHEAHPIYIGSDASIIGVISSENPVFQSFLWCKNSMDNPPFVSYNGLWYKYTSTDQDRAVTAKVNDTNLDITVYQYSTDECYENEFLSECSIRDAIWSNTGVSWNAVKGIEYIILVTEGHQSYSNYFINDRTFELQILPNDSCEYAYGPIVPSGSDYFQGSTIGASKVQVDNLESNTCGGATISSDESSSSSGVWYKIRGNGKLIRAETCGYVGFDTQISVFTGDNCGQLTCIDGNNDACGKQSKVSWLAHNNEMYYVLVYGHNGDQGKFGLKIITETQDIANDVCATAEGIRINDAKDVNIGQLEIATKDFDIPLCYSQRWTRLYSPNNYGAWYEVIGTGKTMQLVDNANPYNTNVVASIYEGSSCSNLFCSVTNRAKQWQSIEGRSYFIYVHYTDSPWIAYCHGDDCAFSFTVKTLE